MDGSVLIYGGTTEGRKAAEALLEKGIPCAVCVATGYGAEVMDPHPLLTLHTGRMDREEMADMIRAGSFVCAVDATHPHAAAVSREIRAACAVCGLPYLRLERETALPGQPQGNVICTESAEEAGKLLAGRPGHVLSTIGSKDLGKFVQALGDPSRVTARVLPTAEALEACAGAGLSGRQIIAAQGPFDEEMNCALLRHTGADWLLTKETGAAGGYPEKLLAAARCGTGAVVIRTPDQGGARYDGMSLAQVLREAMRYAGIGRTLSLVGIGTGYAETRTPEVTRALEEAQAVFGAPGVLRLLEEDGLLAGKTAVPLYEAGAILAYLGDHPALERAAAAYSGDSGFYSGASSLLERVREMEQAPAVRVLCGVSCVSFFAAQAGIPWQNWKILSSHGRDCNVTGQVRVHPECFLLLSGPEDLRRTGARLKEAQEKGVLGQLELIYGYELSRPGQQIVKCGPEGLLQVTEKGLYVLYIRHKDALLQPILPGLPDSAFLRGKVPMTSSEVRALSLSRLGLTRGAVIWDVGAGTGSVSVEAAMACPDGQVWAIERNPEAVRLLKDNRDKFGLQNMEIVEGKAPEVLRDLPAPTHVFIGGSGREIGEILRAVLEAAPAVRIAVNCITAETVAALSAAVRELPVRDVRCAQVSVQRLEKLGTYHFLKAQNPVFLFSMRGAGKTGKTS